MSITKSYDYKKPLSLAAASYGAAYLLARPEFTAVTFLSTNSAWLCTGGASAAAYVIGDRIAQYVPDAMAEDAATESIILASVLSAGCAKFKGYDITQSVIVGGAGGASYYLGCKLAGMLKK